MTKKYCKVPLSICGYLQEKISCENCLINKRFRKQTIDNWESYIFDNVTDKKYGQNIDDLLELLNQLNDKNDEFEKDNNSLIHIIENQSIIIQQLHSKLLEYQLKEPIVLTKEDLEVMGKAIIYYARDNGVE